MEAGAENFCVVQDEKIAALEKFWEIADRTMHHASARAIEDEEARSVAPWRGLADGGRWEMVVEIGGAHVFML